MLSRHDDLALKYVLSVPTGRKAKDAFPDVVTLHALVSPPSQPSRTGTDIAMLGAKDEDVDAAKGFFLRYSGERLLESTEYGDVLARTSSASAARIYVKGLFVAEEPNFLGGFRPSSQQMTDVVDGSDVQRTAVRARSLTGVSVCAAQAWMVAARLRAQP